MAFTRIKPANWAVNETLTSAQMNALDIDHAAAIDGVNGGTLALAALLSFGGTGGVQLNKTFLNPRNLTTGYTLDASGFDFVLSCDTTGPGYNVTLTAAVAGRVVVVTHVSGSNTLGIVPNGANTIAGLNATYSLNQIGSSVVLLGISATAWIAIGKV